LTNLEFWWQFRHKGHIERFTNEQLELKQNGHFRIFLTKFGHFSAFWRVCMMTSAWRIFGA